MCNVPQLSTTSLQVIVSYLQQLQDAIIKEGLQVTRLTVTGPHPFPNETVADQILEQLGQMPFWVRHRSAAYRLWRLAGCNRGSGWAEDIQQMCKHTVITDRCQCVEQPARWHSLGPGMTAVMVTIAGAGESMQRLRSLTVCDLSYDRCYDPNGSPCL